MLGPGIALAEDTAIVRKLAAAAFEKLSAAKTEVATLLYEFRFHNVGEWLLLED